MNSSSFNPFSDAMDANMDSGAMDQESLERIRSILFAHEQQRLVKAEQKLAALLETLNQQEAAQSEALKERAASLMAEIEAIKQTAVSYQEQSDRLHTHLDQLRADFQNETESLIPRLTNEMSGMIRTTIQESRDEMAEALGPVMGDAIRVQIRDSREEMVEALYPIILSTVQRAIAEFARELQRNIDAQLKSTFGFHSIWRGLKARLSGVSSSELQLRDALPFNMREMFLIQHESGLLLAHSSTQSEENGDADLISGMLTAIRDFARDSFAQGSTQRQLDEIQYDDAHIAIQSGQYVYLAVVSTGVEPEWYRSQLRQFISELHIHHAPALRDYAGDPATLPDLPKLMDELWDEVAAPREALTEQPLSRRQKLAVAAGGFGLLALTALACFYLQFTVALFPLAFGETPTATPWPTEPALIVPTSTATQTPLPTATHTAFPTASPTLTQTPLPTATHTPQPTETSTPIPTATFLPTATPAPVTAVNVWVRSAPGAEGQIISSIEANTPLVFLEQLGSWVKVQWQSDSTLQEGWLQLKFIRINSGSPDDP